MADEYVHFSEIGSGSGGVDVKLKSDPNMSRALTPNVKTLSFDGRGYPLGYFGEGQTDDGDYSFINDIDVDGDMQEALEDLMALAAPVQYLDTLGNSFTVAVLSTRWEPMVSNKRLQRLFIRFTRLEEIPAGS